MGFVRRINNTVIAAALALLAVVVAGGQARGQSAGYLGEPRESYRVFVLGDELAGGLWAGLARAVKGNPRISVNGRFNEGTGLARPRLYDWLKSARRIVERHRIDIAVVVFGTNDGRDIRDGGRRLVFNGPEWKKVYTARIDKLIRLLKDNDTAIYWVGLPPMAAPRQDEAMREINKLIKERTSIARVRFLPTRKELGDSDGGYTDKGFDIAGEFRRLRSRNGVKFLRAGNDRLAAIVLRQIRKDMEVADGKRVADDLPGGGGAAAASKGEVGKTVPIFGMALESGADFVMSAAQLPAPGTVVVARAARPLSQPITSRGAVRGAPGNGASIARLAKDTIAGSVAAKLFSQGQWPAAQPGRVDDFTWPDKSGEK